MTEPPREPRWFWWSHDQLDSPWCLFLWGSDEWGRRDLGVRLPRGMLFLALWRFREFRGPCARCGQWEHVDGWNGSHCQSCALELFDWGRGCICPSWMEAADLEGWLDHFPEPGCPVHDPTSEVTV